MSAMGRQIHVEVVQVFSAGRLLDAQGNERTYSRVDGRPLGYGHYLVVWPPGAEASRYDENVRFCGPYDLALISKLKAAKDLAALRDALVANPIAGGDD